MKIKLILMLSIIALSSIQYSFGQGYIQGGNSEYIGDLYHYRNIGVGTNEPANQIDIYNGKYDENPSPLTKSFKDPFRIRALVTLPMINGNPVAPTEMQTYFQVLKNGNVGVGTSEPTTKLHVNGGLRVTGVSYDNSLNKILVIDEEGNVAHKDGAEDWFKQGTTESASNIEEDIYTLGKVSIGSSSSSSNLNIVSKSVLNKLTMTAKDHQTSSTFTIDHVHPTMTGGLGRTTLLFDDQLRIRSLGPDELLVLNKDRVQIGDKVINGGTHDDINTKLTVDGKIISKEVVVTIDNWADFVFEDNYDLRPLKEVEKFININGHLPDVPSEAEVENNGISLGEMNAILLRKVEELTLYMLEQNNENIEMKKQLEQLLKLNNHD